MRRRVKSAHKYVGLPTYLEQPAAFTLRVNVLIYICISTRGRSVAETSSSQHTTLTRDRHHAPIRIRIRNPRKPVVADPRLRSRSHWNRLFATLHGVKYANGSKETCLHLQGTRGGDYSPKYTVQKCAIISEK